MSRNTSIFLALGLLSLACMTALMIVGNELRSPVTKMMRNNAVMNRMWSLLLTEEDHPQHVVECKPRRHVAYIKTHKTGSTTLECIFNRFGFLHNSSFIFNRRGPYGHFEAMDLRRDAVEKYFLPPLGVPEGDFARYKNYDTFAVHARFYRSTFDRYMANDTLYVTSVRDPADQWESAFNQFGFRKAISRVAGDEQLLVIKDSLKVPFNNSNSTLDAINEFLRAPEVYHNKLKSLGEVVWHFGHNDQMFDLGTDLETEQLDNESLVNRTIDRLVRELDFVIVNEYFDESLLVMKKKLCWDFTDILYIPKNKRAEKETLPEETRAKIRTWNHADALLHSRFNETLWTKIKDYGPEFQTDLEHFRQLLREVKSNCSEDVRPHAHGFNYKILASRTKANSSLFCKLISEGFYTLFSRVFQR